MSTESITVEGRGWKLGARGLAAVVVAFAVLAAGGAVAQRHGVDAVAVDTHAAADDVRAEVAEVRADVRQLQRDVDALRDDVAESLRRSDRAFQAVVAVDAWLRGRDGVHLDSADRAP